MSLAVETIHAARTRQRAAAVTIGEHRLDRVIEDVIIRKSYRRQRLCPLESLPREIVLALG